jgi:imidazolonepropionase-like amidohydrolase
VGAGPAGASAAVALAQRRPHMPLTEPNPYQCSRGSRGPADRASAIVVALLTFATGARAETWALVGVRIIPSPSGKFVENGVVLGDGERLRAIGPRGSVHIPKGAREIETPGMTVVAGYWNVHVHFTDERWADAAHRPAEALSRACRDMVASRGFTTVVDLGSDPVNTAALQARARSLDCPRILTSGASMYPVNGVPIYVREAIGDAVAAQLDQPATPEAARGVVRRNAASGAAAIKVFSGSWLGGDRTAAMDPAVVRAVVDEAHRSKLVVFAHPQSRAGLAAAVDGGVDVLAHTAPDAGPWTAEYVQQLVRRHVALAPTLSLWRVEADRGRMSPDRRTRFIDAGAEELRTFAAGGGEVLFGTDLGYVPEADADEEVGRMSAAGMDWRAILKSLTTAPAARFRDSERGTLAPGRRADLVLIEGDPRQDVEALRRVRATWVAGREVFAAAPTADAGR